MSVFVGAHHVAQRTTIATTDTSAVSVNSLLFPQAIAAPTINTTVNTMSE
jgi:hypothetical protein